MPREIPVQAVFMSPQDHAAISGGRVTRISIPSAAPPRPGEADVDWRDRPAQEPPDFEDVRADEAAALIADALGSGGEWMPLEHTARLLDCYRIAIPPWRVAPDPEKAGQAADELGGRVALKAQGPGLVHKTEMGAVRMGLAGGAEVTRAAEEMDEAIARAEAQRESFIVQAMVEGGAELLVGVVDDPTFGPVLACGAGGTQAELLKDVAVRTARSHVTRLNGCSAHSRPFPSSQASAAAPRPTSKGCRSSSSVSGMVEAHHEIAELDLNPVLAGPDGASRSTSASG